MYSFKTVTGQITIDYSKCDDCEKKHCVESCIPKILEFKDEKPVLCIDEKDAAKGRCIECLACELTCEFHGNKAITIDLPLPEMNK